MLAYVLIEAAIGKTAHVLEEIRKIPGVLEADVVTGPYDIIAKVEGDPAEISHVVVGQIRALEGIHHTLTCMAI